MNYSFEPVEWSANTNIYEVNLRQYTKEGTFDAFSEELPRLRNMGVEVLWFMPITPISKLKRLGSLGSYYACSSYLNTNPEFGTIDDFRSLVEKCHQLGFKVIIDWVANHTGWDHEWTKTNPEYYKRNSQGEFYDSNGWTDVIDLNYYDHSMRRTMIGAMEFWIKECGIDGFRCDMAHLVPLDFWRDAREYLDQLKPLFWLAETEDDHYQHTFDCSYAWNWMHLTEKIVKGEASLNDMRLQLDDYLQKKLPSTNHAFFTSNHDENSWNGTEYEKYGNAAICLAVFVCTWSGIPLIYSGQEMPNLKRLNFFDKDPIEWTGKYELNEFYKTLLQLRTQFGNNMPRIEIPRISGNSRVFGFIKWIPGKQIIVLLNLSAEAVKSGIQSELISGTYTDIFTGIKKEAPSLVEFTMEPWDYIVLER